MSTTQQRIFIPLNMRIVLNCWVEFKPPHEPYPLTWVNYLIDVIRHYIAGEYDRELEFPKGYAIYADNITSDTVINQVDQWDLWGFIHLIALENGIGLPENGHPIVPFAEEAYRELIRSKQQRRCRTCAKLLRYTATQSAKYCDLCAEVKALEAEVARHILSCGFPTPPAYIVPVALDAMSFVLQGEGDRLVELPKGVTYCGSFDVKASDVVETFALEEFIQIILGEVEVF